MEVDCSPFDIKDSVHTAVMECLAEVGLKSVSEIGVIGTKSKKKRRGKYGVFGIPLDDDEQEKAIMLCRGRSYHLPKYENFFGCVACGSDKGLHSLSSFREEMKMAELHRLSTWTGNDQYIAMGIDITSCFYLSGKCQLSKINLKLFFQIRVVKFLVQTVEFLKKHTAVEGLFRKTGSIGRQKALQALLERGNEIPDDTHPHDVSSLLKVFIRELPEPLLTARLNPIFYEAVWFSDNKRFQQRLIQLVCLLLPPHHLLCLQALMDLMKLVTQDAESRMDSYNLAIVLAPNLVTRDSHIAGKKEKGSKLDYMIPLNLQTITAVIRILIDNAESIGQIPSDIAKQAASIEAKITRAKLQGRKGRHSRRESVSHLLRGTLNKITGKSRDASHSPSVCSHQTLSPDLIPTSSKRRAVEDSDDSLLSCPLVNINSSVNQSKETLYNLRKNAQKGSVSSLNTVALHDTSFCFPPVIDDVTKPKVDVLSSPVLRQSNSPTPARSTFGKKALTDSKIHARDPILPCKVKVGAKQGCDIQTDSVRMRKRKQHHRMHQESFPFSTSIEPVISSTMVTPIASSQSDMTISNHRIPLTSSTPSDAGHTGDTENCSLKVKRNNDNCTNDVPKSPGLYREVTDGVAEIYRYTPKQFAPIANNQSYMFAVEDTGALKDVHNANDDDQMGDHTPLIGPPSSTKCHSIKKARRRPSLTPSWKKHNTSRKLSRRARQYVVSDESNYDTENQPQKDISISEWIL